MIRSWPNLNLITFRAMSPWAARSRPVPASARRFHLSLRGGAPYHPNAAGMAAVAELVASTR
jgi:hypothetical protein